VQIWLPHRRELGALVVLAFLLITCGVAAVITDGRVLPTPLALEVSFGLALLGA
jgi:hypothetical protein